ncbi:MAG: TatD family hydrolase [Bacteroidales bacterium]|nr:TatD family hydrolase [Bacteroidales bacterium]
MGTDQKRYINIHGHRQANTIEEWVMMNLMAKDFPPDDIENGYYSVGFHPCNIGKVDEQETLDKVRMALEHPRILAVGEIGLDKSLETPMEEQVRIFEKQVEIAESANLPVVLHVVRSFNEMVGFMKAHQPVVSMIIHGYNGSAQMADELVKAGFLISFGEAITGEHSKIIEALQRVPVEMMFLETDEGDMDIRELYQFAAEVKGISVDHLRVQIFENARTHLSRFNNFI